MKLEKFRLEVEKRGLLARTALMVLLITLSAFSIGCQKEVVQYAKIDVKIEWLYIDGLWVHIPPVDVEQVLNENGELIK